MGVDRRIPSVYDTEKGVHMYTKICQYPSGKLRAVNRKRGLSG